MWRLYVAVICWSILSLTFKVHGSESQDSRLRRLQRMIQMDGILRDAKANR